MKGPRQRIDYDVRRVWECPICRRRRKTRGSAVTERCSCQKEGSWMRLIEERRPPKTWPHNPPEKGDSGNASSPAEDTTEPTAAESKQEQDDQAKTEVALDEDAVEASEGDAGNDVADDAADKETA